MDWARLLGVQALGRRWRVRSALGARGVRWRACVGARARAQAWALGAGRSARGAQAAAARARGAQVGARGARPGRGLGALPGRLGWPWAVHSVHSAHFRSVLTRFFS